MDAGTLAQLFPMLMPIAMQAIPQVMSAVSKPNKPKTAPNQNRPVQDPRYGDLQMLYDDLNNPRL